MPSKLAFIIINANLDGKPYRSICPAHPTRCQKFCRLNHPGELPRLSGFGGLCEVAARLLLNRTEMSLGQDRISMPLAVSPSGDRFPGKTHKSQRKAEGVECAR
jgi:hypothetical protein